MFEMLKHFGKELKTWRSFIFSMWGILSVVYCFMLCHFWWGNHDWGFMKSGVQLISGTFEARYSQHIFNVFLFDGNILPVFTFWLSLLFIVIFGILLSYYFKLNQSRYAVSAVVLFVGLNSHNFFMFSYLYLSIPFTFWLCWVVLLLIMGQRKLTLNTIILCGIGYAFLLGGYPPVLALSVTLFCGRQIYDFLYEENTWKRSIYRSVVFVLSILLGAIIHNIISQYLEKSGLLCSEPYNLRFNPLWRMIDKFANSLISGLTQFGHHYLYLEKAYCFVLILGLLMALAIILKDKKEMILGVILLLMASRCIFVLAFSADNVVFRLEYYGRLGVYILSLMLLLKQKQIWMKNVAFVWLLSVFCLFIYTDFFIQKNRCLNFDKGRRYQARILDRIEENENYNPNNKYDVYAPKFEMYDDKYYVGNSSKITYSPEMLLQFSLVFLNFDALYFDESHAPVNKFYYSNLDYYLGRNTQGYFQTEVDGKFDEKVKLKNKYCPNIKSYPSANFICIKDNNLWLDISGK